MTDEVPLTLEQHLGRGYDYYIRGARRVWSPQMLADRLNADDAFADEARKKHEELQRVIKARRQCDISRAQDRILTDAFRLATGQ